jgi:pimeloyl-ACP methyl ester carboxylesterase
VGGLNGYLFASDYPDDVSGLVLVDPGSEFLQTTLTPDQWATFVQAAKQLGDPEDSEAADYESSVDALRAAPSLGAIPAVVLTSDKSFDFGAGDGGHGRPGCSGAARNASRRPAHDRHEQRPLHSRGAAKTPGRFGKSWKRYEMVAAYEATVGETNHASFEDAAHNLLARAIRRVVPKASLRGAGVASPTPRP